MGELIDTMANIGYGILIAIILDALLLFVIASANGRRQLNICSYIIAAILLLPLTFQMSRLIGACQVSDATSAINDIVGTVSPTLSKYVASATDRSIGWFIFRRVLWSLLFMGAAGFGIYATMTSTYKRTRKSQRQERIASRRSGEHRQLRRC